MRMSNRKIVAAIVLSLASSLAFAECDEPSAPIVPDGNVASMDELVSAQKSIKMFQTSLEEYRDCLKGMEQAIDQESEDAQEQAAAIIASYNGSVDKEAMVAEEFNGAVQSFKARQPAEAE